MAIIQRKQLTGTTAQINAYAGVEGQLVWNKTTKRLVGMSGTAGTNYPMASKHHQHSIANVTDLQKALDSKANKAHTHTVSQITDMPNAVLSVNGITPNDGGDVTIRVKTMVPIYGSYISLKAGDFTPSQDGWLRLRLSADTDNRSFTVTHKASNQIIMQFGQYRYPGYGWFMCPAKGGETYKIESSETQIYFHSVW
jgi:hypothetical protein